MKKNFLWIVALFLLANLISPPCTYSQSPPESEKTAAPPLAEETAAVDALIRILVEKGVLQREDIAALAEKKETPGATGIAALAELLKAKGLLTAEEAAKVTRKEAETARTGKETVILYTEKPDPQAMEEMSRDVTRQIQEAQKQVKAEVKKEVMEETKQEIKAAAAPEWTKRIRFGGDMRLRYQGDFFDENNVDFVKPSDPTQLMNTKEDRHRLRVRARIGATAEINESTEAGVRLATGTSDDPVSTNQTLGTYFNNFQVVLDRAYLKWKPVPSLTFWGGRMANPWFHSDLVWDPDVSFDGLAGNYQWRLSRMFDLFATLGAFPLQEVEFSQDDKWLFGGQVGMEFKSGKEIAARIGLAYYDYQNTRGIANDPANPNQFDYTAPRFQQKGNTLFDIDPSSSLKLALASEYQELNLTAALDIGFWDPVHVEIMADIVKNIGFDRTQVASLTGNPNVKEETLGYHLGLSVGFPRPRSWGKWRVFLAYKHLEADAVLDAFTDSDFHLGGTNAKGWILGGELGLARNVWVRLRWLTADEIVGPPLAIDSFFIDLNARF